MLAFVIVVAAQGPPGTDIFLADLNARGARVTVGAPANVTHRPGYDNQPFFTPDGRGFLYTSVNDGQADIWRYDIAAGRGVPLPRGRGSISGARRVARTGRKWRTLPPWDSRVSPGSP